MFVVSFAVQKLLSLIRSHLFIFVFISINLGGGWGFPCSSVSRESACNAGDLGSIPELARSPGEGNGNPLQYSDLENPMDRGAWQVTVHAVARVGHDLATKPPYQQRQIRKQSIF